LRCDRRRAQLFWLCFNRDVRFFRISAAFTLAALLCGRGAFAQDQTPSTQTPPPGATQQQGDATAPEKKISPQEAQDLFKSADEILRFASKQTGLPIKHEVKHKLTSRDEVQKFIEKRMKDDPDRKRLEESEFVMKKFGLLPMDFNLSKFMVAMLREQVAGYYDTKTKTMNLLDWLPPEVQKPVMAHELTHALQDQYVNLDKWEDAGIPEGKKLSLPEQLDLDEERVARQSVTEGQAMLVLIDYSLVPMGSNSAESPDAVKMMEDQMMDGTGSPVFASAPLYIKRAMMFAYREGTEFERQVLVSKGQEGAYKGTLDRPPRDTREVMQPKQYLQEKHVPLLVVPNYDKVLGHDWEQVDFGALGQFDINVLTELYADADTSSALTPEWRGGYYYAAHKKGAPRANVAFVYVSKWSDEEWAENFAKIFANSWKQRYSQLRTGARTKDDDPTLVRRDTEQGLVSVERHGSLVVAMESFPEEEAAKLRKSALEADAGGTKDSAMLRVPHRPVFDLTRFTGFSGLLFGLHPAAIR
jgi:hypothetical protein